MSVWFVSPAFGRYDVSDIVFEQRAWMLDQLRATGLDAHALIVADDGNLELARRHGIESLKHENLPLGRKLNAGIGHAYDQGADHVCFIGSDSMALPGCFTDLAAGVVTYGRWYTLVEWQQPTHKVEFGVARLVGGGLRVPVLNVDVPTWALNVYPRELLERAGGRPVDDERNSGLDGSIRKAIGPYEEQLVDVGPHQVVSLRSGQQITSADRLIESYFVRDGSICELAEAGYAPEIVQRVADFYNERRWRKRSA